MVVFHVCNSTCISGAVLVIDGGEVQQMRRGAAGLRKDIILGSRHGDDSEHSYPSLCH